MSAVELFIIAVGLSMDAFAVSVCKGLGMRKIVFSDAIIIAGFFGGFQALMPCIGWFLGTRFQMYIEHIDHWIAFFILLLIGLNMIKDTVGNSGSEIIVSSVINYQEIVMLAVATSIDALAVGLTIAFLKSSISLSSVIIGTVTFVLSFFGVWVGTKFGDKMEKKAEILGGVLLIMIGTKILIEHLC